MHYKKCFFLATTTILLLSLASFAFTQNELEQVFLAPGHYSFTSTDSRCSFDMVYGEETGQCFFVSPGFWKNRICTGNSQSMSDEQVEEYLAVIRANSQFFSDLTSRYKACTYLKKNNPQIDRAKKFFLANMFNFASGGLQLSTPINSEYSSAQTFAEVIAESDDMLIDHNKDDKELDRIGNLNDDICSGDATDCLHEFNPGGSGCIDGLCTTPCSDFGDFKNIINKIKKIEHTVMLIPLSLESMDSNKPLFMFYDNRFVLNNFTLTLGFFSWDSTTSGTLSDYQNIFNDNEIVHGCDGCNCTTTIKILTDCNYYMNRTIFHFWYYFESKDGPDDPLKRIVYLALKPVWFSFLDDGMMTKSIKLYPLGQDTLSVDFTLDMDDTFLDIMASATPYSLPYGSFTSTLGIDDAFRTIYMLITDEGSQEFISAQQITANTGIAQNSGYNTNKVVLNPYLSKIEEPVNFNFENKLNFALLFSIMVVGFYLAKEFFPLNNIHRKIKNKLFK